MMKATLAALLCILATSASANEWESKVSRVIDGDTFQLSRPLVKIRVCGIDTPEKGQRGYLDATRYVQALMKGKTVQCRTVGDRTPCDGRSRKESYDRFMAQCFVEGKDIAMMLVRSGYACAWPEFSGNHYSNDATCTK
jgi:endonuclease YncB( thermonuclease family)